EKLIETGLVAGVLDLTTTEWADEYVGGTLSAGPERMDAVAKMKVPAVVAPGCLDMVNFGERPSVPKRFEGRNFYIHNPQVTLMRTSPGECRELGKIVASKVNSYEAPCVVMIPTQGISVISQKGQPFYDPEADRVLFAALEACAHAEVVRIDDHINGEEFPICCAQKLLELMATDEPSISSTQPTT
ncbi:MAG: Tm-1-like ATP-binding domain-containing protein, partial [Verrucomicrobiales bacterium]